MLTNQADIEKVLRRTMSLSEIEALPQLDDEARFLIEGYTGVEYDENFPLDIPTRVKTVAIRLVVRALNANPENADVQTRQETSGPFNTSVTYVAGGGGMYLGKAEKQMLSRCRQGFGVLNLGNY